MSKDISLKDVYDLIESFRNEVRQQYVTKDEFMPVKNIAFSLVGIITFTVLGALLTMVIKTVVAK